MSECKHIIESPYGQAVSGSAVATLKAACPWCQVESLQSRLDKVTKERDLIANFSKAPYIIADLEAERDSLRSRLEASELIVRRLLDWPSTPVDFSASYVMSGRSEMSAALKELHELKQAARTTVVEKVAPTREPTGFEMFVDDLPPE